MSSDIIKTSTLGTLPFPLPLLADMIPDVKSSQPRVRNLVTRVAMVTLTVNHAQICTCDSGLTHMTFKPVQCTRVAKTFLGSFAPEQQQIWGSLSLLHHMAVGAAIG